MASRRTSVERAMQRSHGLPDERKPDSGWREGTNGTLYMIVQLTEDALPVDKSAQSLYLDGRGGVRRPVRFEEGEQIVDLVDPWALK